MIVPADLPASGPLVWIVAALLGVVLLPFVLGPLLVRLTQRIRESPTLLRFDPDTQPAPAWVQDYLDESEAAFWGCGFEAIEHIVLPDLIPNVQAIFVLMVRPESNDAAIAVAMFGTGPGESVRKYHVEIASSYTDDFELCTNNSSEESAFRPLPHKRVLQFDFVKDPADIWEIHQRAMREFGMGPKKPVPTKATAIDEFRDALRREFQGQIPVGWLWYDEYHEVFRPTWKGACLMTWKLLWPFVALRRNARRRRSRLLLQEWGLDDLART